MFRNVAALVMLAIFLGLAAVGCDQSSPSGPASDSGSAPNSGEAPAPETAAPPPAGDGETAAPADGAAAAVAEPDDSPAATVNGVIISNRLLNSQVVMAEAGRLVFGEEAQEGGAERAAADLRLRAEVLTGLVGLELACQEAARRGYTPPEEEIKVAMEAFKSDFEEPEEMYKALDQYGQTEEELRDQLIKSMALQKWQENDFVAKITVADDEARAFYDEHEELARHGDLARVSQIFVAVPAGSSQSARDEARAKAESALSRLKAGEDFAAVVTAVSEDPAAAQTSGDLGWVEKGQSQPLLDEAVFALRVGQVSDPVESPLGFHLFQVTEVQPAGLTPFEEVKADIVEYLSQDKMGAAVQATIDELYARADIKIGDPRLKAAFDEYRAAEKASRAAPPVPAE